MLSFLDGGKWHHTHTHTTSTNTRTRSFQCVSHSLSLSASSSSSYSSISSRRFFLLWFSESLLTCVRCSIALHTRAHSLTFSPMVRYSSGAKNLMMSTIPNKISNLFNGFYVTHTCMHVYDSKRQHKIPTHFTTCIFGFIHAENAEWREKPKMGKFSCENEKMIRNLGRTQRRVSILIN